MLRLEGLTLVRVAGKGDRLFPPGSPPVTPRYGPVMPHFGILEVDRNVLFVTNKSLFELLYIVSILMIFFLKGIILISTYEW